MDGNSNDRKVDLEEDIFFSEEDYLEVSCTHYNLLMTLHGHKNENFFNTQKNSPSQETDTAKENSGNSLNESSAAQRPLTQLASLTQFEHALYLELKAKYANRKTLPETAAELQDLNILEELEQRVAQERKRVNEYLFSNACSTRRNDYFTIDDNAKKFINEVVKEELRYCLRYPRYYAINKIIPALVSKTQLKVIPFTFIKVVLKLGQPPRLIVPEASHKFKMFMPYEALMKKYFPAANGDPQTHPSKQHISMDNIAHDLAAKYEADVVITLESLKTLVDNVFPTLERDWEIPIIVSDGPGISGKTCKRIFVEKAIPPSMSIRDKNELYYNYVVRQKFTYSHHPKSRKFQSKYFAPVVPENITQISKEEQAEVDRKISSLSSFDDLWEHSEKVCELDTFGVSAPKKPAAQSKVVDQKPVPVPPKEENDIMVANESPFGSDEDCDDFVGDEDLLNNIKGLLLEQNTPIKLKDSENMNKLGHHAFMQCMSPSSSNADSECDNLVIDCDGEEKQLEKAATESSHTMTRQSQSGSHGGDKKYTDAIHEKIINDVKRKLEAQPQQLCGDDSNNATSEDDIKPVVKKLHTRRLSSPVLQNLPVKKEVICESDVPKEKLQNAVNASPKSTLDEILLSQHKMLKPKEKIDNDTEKLVPAQFAVKQPPDPMAELAQGYPSLPPQDNVLYSLWRLGELKVLLRSELDSQMTPPGLSTTPAFLFPKLEYQMKFGCEKTTLSELIRQWIILHAHPNSHLLKIRIDVATKLMAMLDEVRLPDLIRIVGKDEVTRATQQIFVIMDALRSLRQGQYLLTHKKNDHVFTLREAVDSAKSSDTFDLHAEVNERLIEADRSEEAECTGKVPWLPIDPSVSLPDHRRQKRIPGCFFPKGWNYKKWKAKENMGKSNSEVSGKGFRRGRFRNKGQNQPQQQQQQQQKQQQYQQQHKQQQQQQQQKNNNLNASFV